MTATGCLYGSDLCGRSSYARGGCRGDRCVAANSAYLAEWRQRPDRSLRRKAARAARDRAAREKRVRNPASTTHPDIKPEPPVNTIPLGVFVRAELGRAAAEGFSPEYVAWLERTTKRLSA